MHIFTQIHKIATTTNETKTNILLWDQKKNQHQLLRWRSTMHRQRFGDACRKTCLNIRIDYCRGSRWYFAGIADSRFHLLYNIAHRYSGHVVSSRQALPIDRIGRRNENWKVSVHFYSACFSCTYNTINYQHFFFLLLLILLYYYYYLYIITIVLL